MPSLRAQSWRRSTKAAVGLCALVGVAACAVLLIAGFGTPAAPQSLDRLARQAMSAYYRADEIPRRDAVAWMTRGPGFRNEVRRKLLPERRAALRRYWAGPELQGLLQGDAYLGRTPSCCSRVWNVRTQSYARLPNVTVSCAVLNRRRLFRNAIKIEITERSSGSLATGRIAGAGGRRRAVWEFARGKEWVDLTFAVVGGRLRAVDAFSEEEAYSP